MEAPDRGFGRTRHAIECYGNMESRWIAAFLAVFQQNKIVIRRIGLLPVFDAPSENGRHCASRLTVEYAAPAEGLHPVFMTRLNQLIRELNAAETSQREVKS